MSDEVSGGVKEYIYPKRDRKWVPSSVQSWLIYAAEEGAWLSREKVVVSWFYW